MRGGKYRLKVGVAAAALATGAATLVVAQPAWADWDDPSCYAPPYGTRVTRAIPAHRSQHWVRVRVWSGGWYKVTDLDTNAVVDQGYGTGNWKYTYGLYDERYQLFVSGLSTGAQGTIANCTSGCQNH